MPEPSSHISMLMSSAKFCTAIVTLDPAVEASYRKVIDQHAPGTPAVQRIDRFEFYEKAVQSFAVVMTGESAKYGNILLKKGVTPI